MENSELEYLEKRMQKQQEAITQLSMLPSGTNILLNEITRQGMKIISNDIDSLRTWTIDMQLNEKKRAEIAALKDSP